MRLIRFFLFSLTVVLLFQSCLSPINMAYDNAAPIGKNKVSITAAYNASEEGVQVDEAFDLVNNYMLRIGYGIDETTSLYAGYYHKDERLGDSALFDPTEYAFAAYDFYELGGKFSFFEEKLFALKMLGGAYIVDNELVAYSLYGSGIYTYYPKNDDSFELSFIMHGTFIYERNGLQLLPGFNLSAGFSSNFNHWAIRPEVGFNVRSLTAGIALELKLGQRSKE